MTTKALLAGAGAHGMSTYAKRLLPKLEREGCIKAVGVIEPDAARRSEALSALGLPAASGFESSTDALDALNPDLLIVASPYHEHESACLSAAERGVHLFIEKPVAQDLPACCRIASAVQRSGIKAAVNMSAAFEPEKLAFGKALRDGIIGDIDYIFARLAWDHTAAAKHRAGHPHPYLAEGGVHVLEMLLRYAGGKPARVFNLAWPSAHSVFTGKASNLVSVEMDNGLCCALEGSWTVKAGINTWRDEYIRADGSEGALQLEFRKLQKLKGSRASREGLQSEPILYDEQGDPLGGTSVLLRAFLSWLEGRTESHPTTLEKNLQTMALLFAANASADSGKAIDVQALLRQSQSPGQPG